MPGCGCISPSSSRLWANVRDAPTAVRGVALDDAFHPITDQLPPDRLFCLSLPFLMGRHPFAQGITSSHEMGNVVGSALAQAIGGRTADIAPLVTAEAA